MELLKVKTARFKAVVEQCGAPEVVTLWQDPKDDKEFQRALRSERVMTVHQTVVGSKADFAEVGFAKSPGAVYLIFPKSLAAFRERRVIGIDYERLATPAAKDPVKESDRQKPLKRRATKDASKPRGLKFGTETRSHRSRDKVAAPAPEKSRDASAKPTSAKKPLSRDPFMLAAINEARKGADEGGIPIGAALVREGELLSVGHNKRVQDDDPMTHAETDCLRNAGRIGSYRGCTLYSTLMPCYFCAGAAVQFGIARVIVGESRNFAGAADFMREHGIEVVDLDLEECRDMLGKWIRKHPKLWNEDIGED